MERIQLGKLARWCGGTVKGSGDSQVEKVVTDSRQAGRGSLFICLRGVNADGHAFAGDVRGRGGYSLGETAECDIRVSSSLDALGMIAREYRKSLSARIVAVTGSGGKTTTVRLLSAMLSGRYRTVSSRKSFNNNIGLPLSVLEMDSATEYGIFEMGANHSGEIAHLSSIAVPDAGVITNVGRAHIGFFGSTASILDTKFELADSLPGSGYIVYGYDQKEVRSRAAEYEIERIGFGFSPEADIRAEDVELHPGYSIFRVGDTQLRVDLPGTMNIRNCLAALAAAAREGLEMPELAGRTAGFKAPEHRMSLVEFGGVEVLDDSYNANPDSVKDLFCDLLKIYPQKNIIAVIGEMRELGEFSENLHRKVGEYLAGLDNVKYVIAGGRYAGSMAEGAESRRLNKNSIFIEDDPAAIAGIVRKIADRSSLVVLKASRAQHYERVLEKL